MALIDASRRSGVWGALALAAVACSSAGGDAGSGKGGGTAQGAGGAGGVLSSSSSSSVAVAVASVGAGGADGGPQPFVCDPPAAPGSLYELSAVSYNINEIDPVSLCKYRGEVMLIVDTAAL